jgi:hypothetical protein
MLVEAPVVPFWLAALSPTTVLPLVVSSLLSSLTALESSGQARVQIHDSRLRLKDI